MTNVWLPKPNTALSLSRSKKWYVSRWVICNSNFEMNFVVKCNWSRRCKWSPNRIPSIKINSIHCKLSDHHTNIGAPLSLKWWESNTQEPYPASSHASIRYHLVSFWHMTGNPLLRLGRPKVEILVYILSKAFYLMSHWKSYISQNYKLRINEAKKQADYFDQPSTLDSSRRRVRCQRLHTGYSSCKTKEVY